MKKEEMKKMMVLKCPTCGENFMMEWKTESQKITAMTYISGRAEKHRFIHEIMNEEKKLREYYAK